MSNVPVSNVPILNITDLRIASLLPSATDIVAALGLGAHLVAVSHSCDHEIANGLPVITRSIIDSERPQLEIDRAVSRALRLGLPLYQVLGERLEQLRPNLILTQGVCEVCAVTPQTLQASIRYLPDAIPSDAQILTLSGENLHGILADVYAVGRASHWLDRANSLIERAEDDWNALEPVAHAPRVMTLEWSDPPFFGGHWVPEQVTRAGGLSVLGGEGIPSGRTTWAHILETDPDVIVVMSCGYGLAQNARFAETICSHLEARGLRAVRAGQVWAVDANALFSRPSLGVVRGAFVLRELLLGRSVAGSSVRVAPVVQVDQVLVR